MALNSILKLYHRGNDLVVEICSSKIGFQQTDTARVIIYVDDGNTHISCENVENQRSTASQQRAKNLW